MIILESIYKKIHWWYVASKCIFLPAIIFPLNTLEANLTIFFTLLLELIVLYYSMILYRKIPGVVSLPWLFVGIIIVLGGSLLDMVVTVMCSPGLSEEGNPVIVMLLNNKFSILSIYLYTFVSQMLEVSIILYLWSCFLKTYPNMLKSIPYVNFFTTIRGVIGAEKMRLSDFFFQRNVQFYRLVPLMSVILVVSKCVHWYAAMEWLKIINDGSQTIVLAAESIFISFIIFVCVTHYQLKQRYHQGGVKS